MWREEFLEHLASHGYYKQKRVKSGIRVSDGSKADLAVIVPKNSDTDEWLSPNLVIFTCDAIDIPRPPGLDESGLVL